MVSRLKRSCLSMVSWFFVGLALIFLVGNAYVILKMAIAQSKLDRVAAQLGYSPDDYSTDFTMGFDPNPFFPVMGAETQLLQRLFSTPLSPAEVQTRLTGTNSTLKASESRPSGLLINSRSKVDGTPAQELKAQGMLPDIPRYCWRIVNGETVCIHETAILERTIEIRGKAFIGNVIEIQIIAVRTQLWMLPGLSLWKRMQT